MAERVLVVENLGVFYGEFQALFGVNLEVAAGETIAILGANGAGKTTLLNTIAVAGSAPGTEADHRGRGVSAFGVPACRRGISMVQRAGRSFLA
jgi:branched-chain amino acid transport system ATP-binding protein